MKKLLTVSLALCMGVFIACNNPTEKKSENTTQETTTVNDSDTTQYACSCDHKCKTKEECKEHCGEECMKHQ